MGKITLDFSLMTPLSLKPIPILQRSAEETTFAAIPVMLKEEATDKGMILVKNLTAGPNENDTILIKAHKN
jgi:hypothetical protein